MLNRVIPHPLLTLVLAAVWLLLMNDFSVGALFLALLLGLLIPYFTRRFWPNAPTLRRPWKIVTYSLLVLWDIVTANVQVAYLVLFRRNDEMKPAFVSIPLEVQSPEAIAVLAGTITMTPGTVSSDLSSDQKSLLVHCLDAPDPEAIARDIKGRYEARLKEIFG
ncbi:MAG TPA: Na+/H+ antiporter subunit E [Kiloniellales bacterium]|jgi:multicomponent K+:H+ antiporter subunit E|nr:Na+/H+ antiporter subunit E [Kiloniellales bacterium]